MLNLTKCKIALSNLNWTELYEYISGVYGLLAACAAMWQSERYISRVYCTVCALARVCRHVAVRAIYQPRVLYCMCSGPRVPPCGSQSDISAAGYIIIIISYSLIEGGTFQYQHTYYPNTNLTILAA